MDPLDDRLLIYGGVTLENGVIVTPDDVVAVPFPAAAWMSFAPPGGPGGRSDPLVVLDPAGHRMILLGGAVGSTKLNDVWILDLSGTPAWTQLLPDGTPPPGRTESVAIFDPVRNRLVAFGGVTSVSDYDGDVWALTLSGTPTWAQLSPAGAPPAGRRGHAAAYDPDGDRMIVFGGSTAGGLTNDVWALSLAGGGAWAPLAPSGAPPAVRSASSATYDPLEQRLIVFGGFGSGDLYNDAWALSLAGPPAWSALSPAGPLPEKRGLHRAALDATRNRILIHGGYPAAGFPPPGLWALDLSGGTAWENLAPDGAAPREEHLQQALYDPVSDRFVVGGNQSCGQPPLQSISNQALQLDGLPGWDPLPWYFGDGTCVVFDSFRERAITFNAWNCHEGIFFDFVAAATLPEGPSVALTPAGTPPSSRVRSHGAYDPVRDRLLIHGGDVYGTPVDDLWELTLGDAPAWTQLSPTNALPIVPRAVLCDPARDRLLAVRNTEVWALPLTGSPTWSQVSPGVGTAWLVVFDPVRDRLVALQDASAWALPLSGGSWTALAPSGAGPAAGLLAAYDPRRDAVLVQEGLGTTSRTWALAFGEPARPGSACLSEGAQWTPGEPLAVSYALSHALSGDRAVEWRLDSARDWPGFPLHGLEVVSDGGPHALEVSVPAPDSTAAGANELRLTVWLAGGRGNDSTCTTTIVRTPAVSVPRAGGLALAVTAGSPARDLRLSLTLPSDDVARVGAFDLSGRRVASRTLDGLGAGRHVVELPAGGLAPGVYLIRVEQNGRAASARAVLVR